MSRLAAFALVVAFAASCGGKLPPVPAAKAPSYPEFVFPGVPSQLAKDTKTAARHDRGWRFLQAGELKNAGEEFSAALKRSASFFPSEAGLGYVELARKDYAAALACFDRALQRSQNYTPALVGRGDSLLGLSRPEEAQQAFEAALAADATLSIARQRLQVLKLRTVQQEIGAARRALDSGKFEDARHLYERAIAASPDSSFLYRDLAGVQQKLGDREGALASVRRAVDLDPGDVRSLVLMGEILEGQGDFDGAVTAYTKAQSLEPADELLARIDAARERAAMLKLPQEFAQIASSTRLTRADLAALVGVHFTALLDAHRGRQSILVTDTRRSWAAPWILAAVRAGVMEVFPNHTFQPASPVRRLDLARVLGRLMNLASADRPSLAARWQAKPPIADVPAGHLGYAAVAQAVAAGVMPLAEDNTFRPSLVVSGAEAIQVIERLEALIEDRS